MVQAGIGLGVMPLGSVGLYNLANIRTLDLDEPWARRELSLCVRSREGLSSAARLFFDHLLGD
jgi:DNA-binding transcriptional LysR family regulator